ncbi:hypothetical protein N7456_012061 [Penicillium angulare]|uniref:HTH CENPB-type domain-containing protein n=1 Tax=Penicillium angulare TaxID=116970 RepID=A0A9W9EV58_9EURO|nr:hypothetical protein N7456_012061 [Penicillium angulare]
MSQIISEDLAVNEDRIREAVEYIKTLQEKPNIYQIARDYDVPAHILRARYLGRKTQRRPHPNSCALSQSQEKALTDWYLLAIKANHRPTPMMITRSANKLLERSAPAGSEPRKVGKNWAWKFSKRVAEEHGLNLADIAPSAGKPPVEIDEEESRPDPYETFREKLAHMAELIDEHYAQQKELLSQLMADYQVLLDAKNKEQARASDQFQRSDSI